MHYTFKTSGVCARAIEFDLDDGVVSNVRFAGGCMGNTTGVAKLAEGRRADELISVLEGIQCGMKGTSCPDQLAKAIKEALK